jgi:hypothetical protein
VGLDAVNINININLDPGKRAVLVRRYGLSE